MSRPTLDPDPRSVPWISHARPSSGNFRSRRTDNSPHDRWLRGFACLPLWFCLTPHGYSQTAVEVPQALVIRNSGSVRVVGKDGVARSACASPVDAGKPVTPSTQRKKVTDPAPGKEKVPMTAVVFAGETVTVDKNGSADLALAGAGVVRMQPEVKIKLPERISTGPAAQSLELLKGKLFINVDAAAIKNQDNQEFRLKTPTTILAVKGTRFFADSSASGDVIGVHQGEVSVTETVSKQTQLIGAGKATEASPGKLSAARALTPQELAEAGIYAGLQLEARGRIFRENQAANNGINEHHMMADLSEGKFFWQCTIKPTYGRDAFPIDMNWMLNKIVNNTNGCAILPLGPEQQGASVAGVHISCSLSARDSTDPVALEFSITGTNIKAFRILTPTKTTEKGLVELGDHTPTHGNKVSIKDTDQPFWKVEIGNKRSTVKLLPTDNGVFVPVNGKDRWTKVQLGWNTLGPASMRNWTKEKNGKSRSFFIVTYPGNPEYADDGKTLEFSIRDAVLLYRSEK